MGIPALLNRLNERYPWSHNDHYHRWILSQLPDRSAAALDVGCGTGNLLLRLHGSFGRVVGIEPDAATAARAAAAVRNLPGVTIEHAGFDAVDAADPHRRYDLITLVAVLHHLPLASSLRQLRNLLAPGGRIIVVGVQRETARRDRLLGLLSVAANPLAGFAENRGRRAGGPPAGMTAPVAAPRESLADIAFAARDILPGARIRRRLFWRYTLVFDESA